MQSINTSLTVINETDVRGQALLSLITQYISIQGYYGFRSIGSNPNIVFPCLFVEPKMQVPEMVSTAKFQIRITYRINWFVRESTAHDAVSSASFIGEALIKLFSNNALGDLQSANPPSNKFKQYANPGGGYYWLDSEMSDVHWSDNYLDADPSGARYERAGRMLLRIEDVILK